MLMKLHSEEGGRRTQQYDTINGSESKRQLNRAQQFVLISNNIRFLVVEPYFYN